MYNKCVYNIYIYVSKTFVFDFNPELISNARGYYNMLLWYYFRKHITNAIPRSLVSTYSFPDLPPPT